MGDEVWKLVHSQIFWCSCQKVDYGEEKKKEKWGGQTELPTTHANNEVTVATKSLPVIHLMGTYCKSPI